MALRRLLAALLALAVVASAAPAVLADDFVPGPGAAGTQSLVGFIDSPAFGQAVSPSFGFIVSGWVVDLTAEGWSGVTSVEVFDGRIESGGRLLASGAANLSRPDVAAFLGYPFWEQSGFSIPVVGGLTWGQRTLTVYAVTPHKGRWLLSLPVVAQTLAPSPTDAFPNDPVVRVFDPLPGAIVRSPTGLIRGIALDRNSGAGTGVDRVEIYLDGPRDSGAPLVAVAELNKRYGEPGLEFGDARFDNAGWDAPWEPRRLTPGDHELWVYARRAGTDVWNLSRVRFTVAL